MCGIFGYVGDEGQAATAVLSGLIQLEYRGYDSWGVAVAHGGRLAVEKRIGRIGDARPALPAGPAALGHTRWATHGGVTVPNAHPHEDCRGRLALIHNGIVANESALRAELTARGHRFASETDSEVVVHLLEELLDRAAPGPDQLVRATIEAFRRLEGLNAIAVLDSRTGELAAAKNGSPLVLGWLPRGAALASDPGALAAHTSRLTFVEDGQAALITRAGHRVFDISTFAEVTPQVFEGTWAVDVADRGGYAHFMEKEIAEQPAVLRRLADADDAGLAAALAAAQDVVLTGCGSAGHAGLAAQYALAAAGVRARVVPASELPQLESFLGAGSLVVALSQSGETADVLEAVKCARRRGARIAALVNVPGSSLWRGADVVVPLDAGAERSVLATKSYTAKLARFAIAAAALSGKPAASVARDDVRRAAHELERLFADGRRMQLRALAREIAGRAHLLAIGRGASWPQALEAALKIKEASYVHAEGFAAGELKHGVIALVEPGTPCLVIAPDDGTHADARATAHEVRARGARVIGIAASGGLPFDENIAVPDLGAANGIAAAVVAQLLAYEIAVAKGLDPDRPRNLAKSVTVR